MDLSINEKENRAAVKKRDTFSWTSVRYIGWIEDNNQGTPLTGSCKVLKFQDTQWKIITIVIDFGLYQWWKKLWDLNKSIDEEALNADYIIITHAHLDHVWRLPMLTREWFTGKIIMTPETKALAEYSLIDSAKVMKDEANMIENKNKREWERYRIIKKYVNNLEKLSQNWLKKREKAKLEWENEWIKQRFNEVKLWELIRDLESVDGDISKLLSDVVEPLFSLDDVEFLFSGKKSNDTSWEKKKRHSISTVSTEQAIKLDIVSSHTWAKDLKNTPQIESILLEFFDAAHILGSVQAQFTAQVKTLLSWTEALKAWSSEDVQDFRFLFSWDLWREDAGNNAGTLKMPSGQYEFVEIEWTYADRNHPDRNESISKLYDTLLNSGKHILLPTFSLQRTQDTLLLLLDYIEKIAEPKRLQLIDENKKYKKEIWKLKEVLEEDIWDGDTDTIKLEIESIQSKISKNEWEIDRLDITIISDSPLSHRLNAVYQVFNSNTYTSLTKEAQQKRFWKERIKFLDPKSSQELFDLYSTENKAENKKKKDRRTKIIVSSWWMCEWGPVIEHLKRMLSSSDATIVLTGYAPPESLWGQIRTDSQVIIDGQLMNVKARIDDITWFSWHAWKSTLIKYLNSASSRVTTIVHWWNDRYKLAKDDWIKSKRGIKIPAPWDVIKMPFRKSKSVAQK